MWSSRLLVPAAAGLVLGGAVQPVPAAAAAHPRAAACPPSASLLGFSDALDKARLDGTAVSGLSALGLVRPGRAAALVGDIGTTPARMEAVPRVFASGVSRGAGAAEPTEARARCSDAP